MARRNENYFEGGGETGVAGTPSGGGYAAPSSPAGTWVNPTTPPQVNSPTATPRIRSGSQEPSYNFGGPLSPNTGIAGGTRPPVLQGGGSGAGAPSASSFGGVDGNWLAPNRDMIKAYGRSRGVEMNDQQADYWVNQWSNLMRESPNDPSYATMRLSLANEWTPPEKRYMAGSGGAGGGSEFVDPWGNKLEQLVSEYLGQSRHRAEGLANTYRARAKELSTTPAYTSQEEAAIRARSFDQLERRRQETIKNGREQVYVRGFAPTSGLTAGSDRNINTQFEQARTGIESDLLRAQLDETERRKDAALQLEALATEALNGGDLGAIQATGLPLQLMNTRQSQALATYGASQGNALSSILQILNSASGNQQNARTNGQSNAAGLGSIIQLLLSGLGGR